jgi:predicted  nucleic acid-binding Zn-ribbon protein
MGNTLEAMFALQAIERQLADIRGQLNSSNSAVSVQQRRVDELHKQHQLLHDEVLAHQKDAGGVELELKAREEEVNKLRVALNSTKTNKEYAAVLTQLNTLKADNSKLEDRALELMQEVDQTRTRMGEVEEQVAKAEKLFEQIKRVSSEEISRLQAILDDLQAKRDSAAQAVPDKALKVFDRIAAIKDGDVMAGIEAIGKKPPYHYICGGCNMSLTAEHANALRTRDEIRFCDCCGRVLYLKEEPSPQKA